MPASYRVRKDPFTSQGEVLSNDYAVDFVRGSWRLYQYHQDYSATSGGFLVKDTVVRRYDPAAGADEGKPATFASKEEAVAYWQRWIQPYERRTHHADRR